MRARHLGLAVGACIALSSGVALANGRYPNADMLVVDPGDPSHLVMRTTFGSLLSRDAGQHWSWVCEGAVGYVDGDPALTVLSGGRTLLAFLGNIVLSSDDACSYSLLPFDSQGRFVVDVTLDAADASHAWVLTSGFMGRREVSVLDVSQDSSTLTVVSPDFVPSTFEVARSRPERMYIVGFDGNFQATLLASDDRGKSWAAHPLALYPTLPMYLSAIDPNDPNTLYVRVDDGSTDHLLVSRDGGQSFSEALTIAADMLGFALSPDGSRVAAGGPGDGLYVANTSDLVFSRAASVQSIRCLTWSERGLFACAQESLDQWTVALSSDQGQSFEPLWHIQDLVPLECAAGSPVENLCPRAWLDIASRIGADLVPGESQPSPEPAPRSEGSSCAFSWPARPDLGALGVGTLGAALAVLLRRRRAAR